MLPFATQCHAFPPKSINNNPFFYSHVCSLHLFFSTLMLNYTVKKSVLILSSNFVDQRDYIVNQVPTVPLMSLSDNNKKKIIPPTIQMRSKKKTETKLFHFWILKLCFNFHALQLCVIHLWYIMKNEKKNVSL